MQTHERFSGPLHLVNSVAALVPFQMVFVNGEYAEIEVWVEVGGERVEEFQPSQLNDTTQTCYIPSKAGEVRICNSPSRMSYIQSNMRRT